jgi:ATP-dependent exoDNAse (exonuclease V) beta subunit
VFYSRFLKLPQENSAAQRIGSVLHKVLERFHAVYRTFDATPKPVETVGAWIDALLALRCEEWDATAFTSEPVAAAAARAADVALRAYAPALAKYAESHAFEVEHRELRVSIPVGSSAIEGRLDRVDRLEDGTRIVVDYKRGTAKESAAKAAQSQLKRWGKSDAAGSPRAGLIGDPPKGLDLQLAFYATALEQVTTLAKIYLGGAKDTPKRDGTAKIDPEPFDGPLQDVARAALAELERDALEPLATGTLRKVTTAVDVETCTYCAFVTICPGPVQGR